MIKLIVQIPCLNEEATLPRVLDDIPSRIDGIDVIEILVIDDGSKDNTSQIARDHGVKHILRHCRNRGLAASFSNGIAFALDHGADIIINTDGDHQYPGRYMHQLVAPILSGQADIVVGDRRPHLDSRAPLLKRLLYRIGSRVVSVLANENLPDPVSGYRSFSREAANRIHIVTAYSYTIESLVQAAQKGIAIAHVPIETNDKLRESRLFSSIPRFVVRSAATLLRVSFMYHSLQTLLIASAATAVIGLLPIFRFLYLYTFYTGEGHLQSVILGSCLLVVAGLLLVAGLIADLISHNRQILERTLEDTLRESREPPKRQSGSQHKQSSDEHRLGEFVRANPNGC